MGILNCCGEFECDNKFVWGWMSGGDHWLPPKLTSGCMDVAILGSQPGLGGVIQVTLHESANSFKCLHTQKASFMFQVINQDQGIIISHKTCGFNR